MLVGTVLGGVVAQATNLGVPYIVRAVMLGVTLVVALLVHARPRLHAEPRRQPGRRRSGTSSAAPSTAGCRNRPVRWLMLAAPFTVRRRHLRFYAFQPYLLELYGDPTAYSVAGLAAAIVAGAQILGGLARLAGPSPVQPPHRPPSCSAAVLSVVLLALIGLTDSFVVALVLLAVWAFVFAAASPMRQAFVNG